MLTLKNNQLFFKSIKINLNVFVKFTCVFALLFLSSCKPENGKKETISATSSTGTAKNTPNTQSKKIIVFGDSLTAGYGLEDVKNAFPGLIQDKIDSLNLDYTIINSGVSGETTSGGINRIEWVLNEEPKIFILELGANDGLRGVALEQTKKNLQGIIDAVKTKYPSAKIVLAGMQLPPNMGQSYSTEFKNIFPALAEKNNVTLIPFLLDNVGGVADLNQADGIHPTKEGHEILADNVWDVLKPLLK
ncbi:arylesterase [Chryseobacterium sp. MP_3.2]|uniref:arylesterase n=1 Tax=Chryseobacterium sp. MP_3.2 TaxID=3071712 RepID=UPI002E02950B|nr:acyl-CoA thioesterase-1 [Chryseobacterium sp. MP_3.2]